MMDGKVSFVGRHFFIAYFTMTKERANPLQILSSSPFHPHAVNIVQIYLNQPCQLIIFLSDPHSHHSPIVSIYHLTLAGSNVVQEEAAVWSTTLGLKDEVTSGGANLNRAVGAWGTILQKNRRVSYFLFKGASRTNETSSSFVERSQDLL
jgi:hypothetical protein